MDLLASIGLGMIGFLIGNIAFSRVGHWIVALHQIAKDEGGAKTSKFASAMLLSAGPWFLVAVGVFAYFIYPQPWSTPIFVGALIAVVFFSAFSVHLARKAAGQAKVNPTPPDSLAASPHTEPTIRRIRYPAIIRTKRNFLSMLAGIALLVGSPILWLSAPPGTPFSGLVIMEVGLILSSTVAGLYIWALVGPATSTGTPIIGTGPTPPPEQASDE